MLRWLLNDEGVLKMFLAGGLPEGPYEDTLDVLTTLYMTYKDSDLVNENPAVGSQEDSTSLRHDSSLKLKDVYLKMILADALTFSGSVYFWADGNEYSDPIDRHEIFKKMSNEKMFVEYSSFENLTVEEMRWMFNSIIDDEEIEWLNWYIDNKLNGRTNPYAFMAYTSMERHGE
ncbi:MAG: hypothetical protein LUD48_05665 [Prevotella sp.]|nr:hypothetical protein [Prevotella sp.]